MSDAFDVLRADTTPIDPPDHVRIRLRRLLVTELEQTMTDTAPATTTTPATAPATATVTAYLTVRGASAAIDFYVAAFGAVEDQRMVSHDGRIGHAEITIGTTRMSLADEYPEAGVVGPATLGGSTTTFQLTVDDADRAMARAVEHGATMERPAADQFHGSRNGVIRDPFGHRWMLSAPIPGFGGDAAYEAGAAEIGFEVQRRRQAPLPHDQATHDQADHQVKAHSTGDLYYFTLPVRDLACGQAFFGAVLGWQFPDPANGHVGNISAPPGGLESMPSPSSSAGARLWFVVPDIHAAVARVRESGGTAAEPVYYDSGWAAECADDQGTEFHLSVPVADYTR